MGLISQLTTLAREWNEQWIIDVVIFAKERVEYLFLKEYYLHTAEFNRLSAKDRQAKNDKVGSKWILHTAYLVNNLTQWLLKEYEFYNNDCNNRKMHLWHLEKVFKKAA